MELASVTLLTAWFCPFAQRARIALEEKGIGYEAVESLEVVGDGYKKNPDLLQYNPSGLVPVLIHRYDPDQPPFVCPESMVIVDYVDEAWPGNRTSFMPLDPRERARCRLASLNIAKKIVPTFYKMLVRQDPAVQETAKDELLEGLLTFSKGLPEDGPFFLGERFSGVDILLAPWALRMFLLKHFRGFEVPADGPFAKYLRWFNAIRHRPSVKATIADDDKLIAMYQRYAAGSAETKVADAVRRGESVANV
ncbi:hypothetical protein PBRA_004830 [Plasmodiophora brassicae]|nr:hypothetical protein PBRA_004830 [Plasmodiophora brassicae]